MKYQVVIPSYDRVEKLQSATLLVLKNGGVPKNNITIFVANKEQQALYKEHFSDYTIVVGVIGLQKQLQFINEYYKNGEYIIKIDDDIDGIFVLDGKKIRPVKSLPALFQVGYEEMEKHNAFLWGPNRSTNPRFMNHRVTDRFNFIQGGMYGYINRHDTDLRLTPSLPLLEDVERTIKYWLKDGVVIRLNDICYKTKFGGVGGLQTTNPERKAETKKQAEEMFRKYPNLIKGIRDDGVAFGIELVKGKPPQEP